MNLLMRRKPSPVPLSASARRVLGVLVEKAKTTPDNYPLTLSGIVTGSNQKSNRDPKMDLDDEDALLALDELRRLGAAREVQGSGRAIKYRHSAYDWLDVDGARFCCDDRVVVERSPNFGRTAHTSVSNAPIP